MKEKDNFWNWVYPEGANPEQVQNELDDYHTFMKFGSEVYCALTGGQISKINTLPNVVIAEAEHYAQEKVKETLLDELETLDDNMPYAKSDIIELIRNLL